MALRQALPGLIPSAALPCKAPPRLLPLRSPAPPAPAGSRSALALAASAAICVARRFARTSLRAEAQAAPDKPNVDASTVAGTDASSQAKRESGDAATKKKNKRRNKVAGADASRSTSEANYSQVHQRVTWLNANVFKSEPIGEETIAAVAKLGLTRAFELLKEAESKASAIKSPTDWLAGASHKEAIAIDNRGVAATSSDSGEDFGRILRRTDWLSENVFKGRPIDEKTISAMKALGTKKALVLMKQLEKQSADVEDPSSWLSTEARKSKTEVKGVATTSSDSNEKVDRIVREAKWLSANVFKERPIDEEATSAMNALSPKRALALMKQLQGKSADVEDPSGWLKTEAEKIKAEVKGSGAREVSPGAGAQKAAKSTDANEIFKRGGWLSRNIFADRPIKEEALVALLRAGMTRAMELFQECEQRTSVISDPTGWLLAAAMKSSTEPQAGIDVQADAAGTVTDENDNYNTANKRVTWMNGNIFKENQIDSASVHFLAALDAEKANRLCSIIEEKAAELKNPSSYIKVAVKRELGVKSMKARVPAGPVSAAA